MMDYEVAAIIAAIVVFVATALALLIRHRL